MRLADRSETEWFLDRLSGILDGELSDADHAIVVLDRFVEWLALDADDMKVQKAYAHGDPVKEWGGIPARETLALVTPASILNSIIASEFEAAALIFTPDGIAVVLREPGDPSG